MNLFLLESKFKIKKNWRGWGMGDGGLVGVAGEGLV